VSVMSKEMDINWKDAWEIIAFYEEKLKGLPIKNPAELDQEELDAVLAIQLESKKEIDAFFDRRDEENRKRHEERLARYAAEAHQQKLFDDEARARRARARREALSMWLTAALVIGGFIFVCALLTEPTTAKVPQKVHPAYEWLNGLEGKCKKGDALSCLMILRLAKQYDPVERCLYGDGDHEACQDAAFEAEERRNKEDY
jgi:hypothetical protein